MRLYSYCKSSASYRVRIALALKGVAHEYVAVNITRDVNAQGDVSYGAVNPMRQVPVLELEDEAGHLQRLTQSVAIVEYLDERWPDPPLFARDALQRARQREAVELVNSGIQPLQNNKALGALRAAGGAELEERFRSEVIARGLRALEVLAQRQQGSFFFGDSPSAADLFLIPQLYNARRFGVEIAPGSRILQIESHALHHQAFRAAHPDRQPDASPAERSTP
jgi:maleylpyruvate isomerase